MVRVVGVRFKKAGKVYYFDPSEYEIAAGEYVVVETARGVEYGEVAVGPKDVDEDQVVQPLKKVLRVGTEKDAVVAAENKRKENEAFGVAQKKIEAHSLDMNLVDVEYTFDGSKIIFYFTAEGRIDFRELVRDLAGVFRTRIEMRQIGVRDEAKLLGGIGPCGRILCCTSFLGDFAPVSIRMAKDQNLSLNPSKISGLCGRLMCCLRYEQETYEAAKKDPTLAPGYVPPTLPSDDVVPEVAELEDRPVPAIGIRRDKETGMSARIAQAVSLVDRPVKREDRPAEQRGEGERPASTGGGRPQGQGPAEGPRRPMQAPGGGRGQQPRRAEGGSAGQGQAQGQGGQGRGQGRGQGQPQGERQAAPGERPAGQGQQGSRRQQGGPKQGGQPRGQQGQGQAQGQGQSQPGQQQVQGQGRGGQGRGERQGQPRQNQGGPNQGAQPRSQQNQAQGQPAEGVEGAQHRRHHRGHRRRGGGGNPSGNPGGGPQDSGAPQA